MKAILITETVEALASKYSKNLFASRKRPTFVKPLPYLRKLLNDLRAVDGVDQQYKRYVRNIIAIYPVINAASPKRCDEIHKSLFADFQIDLSEIMEINDKKKAFYKHVVAAMRYDAVRDVDFLHYAKELGIRACIYCNANYAVTTVKGKKIAGKYELDHYKSQSRYPYLCTNFYNLYPVCGNCNKAKLHGDTSFSLYTEDPLKMYPFCFSLEKKSIVKYMLSQRFEDLNVSFSAIGHADHNTVFHIEATYNALKDVAEELVWKHKVYNQSYMQSLNDAFGKKFSITGFNRFILGNYDQPNDIHKRPLSKLIQDIAKQLGVIK